MAYIGSKPADKALTGADIEDGTITTSDLQNNAVNATKLDLTDDYAFTGTITGAGGITVAQQFRLTTGFSTTSTVISSNWEQVDTDGYGGIGTAMSESSGVFTFPTTGIYLISISADAFRAGDTRYWEVSINTTTDNSTYNVAADSLGGISYTGNDTHDSVYTEFIFDVTDVSTHKVRFGITADQSTTILGDTTKNITCATFIRLGDT